MADVTFTGPFFEPEGGLILADGTLAARHAVAYRGIELVRAAFDEHIRVNSGRHTASITVTDESRAYTSSTGHRSYTMNVEVPERTSVVTTSNATYGPWLEGTGSRNATTRFKGYWGFQQATSSLDGEAHDIAAQALVPYIDKLNG